MERILRVADYPNLIQLKLFNFNKEIVSCYFKGNEFTYIGLCSKTEIQNILKSKGYAISMCFLFCLDDSVFRHISKQITDLHLISNENRIKIFYNNYTMNVYAIILSFFKNLKHLTITPLSAKYHAQLPFNYLAALSSDYHAPLSLKDLSSNTFFSSILTKLSINVLAFDDCVALLDGRLKQLITFIVQIVRICDAPSISYNMVNI
jgi:hypothetical protein